MSLISAHTPAKANHYQLSPFSSQLATLIICAISLILAAGAVAKDRQPFATANLTTKHLIPGERAYLFLSVQNGRLQSRPATPQVDGLAINFQHVGTQTSGGFGGFTTTHYLVYTISAVEPGDYTLPPFQLQSTGQVLATPSINFTVHDGSELVSFPTPADGPAILAGMFLDKDELYQGEYSPLTFKLYKPSSLRMAALEPPTGEKQNCAAWRFSQSRQSEISELIYDNERYNTIEFHTNVQGIQPGKATFGPSELKVITRHRYRDGRGFLRSTEVTNEYALDPLEFTVLPLPAGAPDGFSGAVGRFSIETSTPKQVYNSDATVAVDIIVSGEGNLDSIKCPEQLDGESWNVIDSSRTQRNQERRQLDGHSQFRQLMRPLELVKSIPAYQLHYFDPETKNYHTALAPEIPISLLGEAPQIVVPTGDLSTPASELRDILSISASAPLIIQPRWWWNIAPLLVVLVLAAGIAARKYQQYQLNQSEARALQKNMRQLGKLNKQAELYREAARIIETKVDAKQLAEEANQELAEIIQQRDLLCFQLEQEDQPVDAAKKGQIIKTINRAIQRGLIAGAILFAFGISQPQLQASENTIDTSYQEKQFNQALETAKQQLAETNKPAELASLYYKIGNIHYRLEQPAQAALAWRRALHIAPNYREARHNLKYLEHQQEAIVPSHHAFTNELTRLTPQVYLALTIAMVWLTAIAAFIRFAYRPGGWKTNTCLALMILCPSIAVAAAASYHYFPDDHQLARYSEQAILADTASLFSQPFAQSARTQIDAPAASLVKIITQRGEWNYVELANGEIGWIPADQLLMLESTSN
ncbi:BatD family protein [Persicirhabdus sediminis]|uniref:BatD family protein n=1 Tax=Persicirhabdus sediminis TaxID=454144 RepID=A0A8J7MEA0_9BACT|nr:BatD family protein [Persicirhabdus sediminis]MBK1792309.1 BatD family protein [Persicirhabdus sediminis]